MIALGTTLRCNLPPRHIWKQGDFVPVTTIPAATLAKVLQGARDSRELSADKKRLVG